MDKSIVLTKINVLMKTNVVLEKNVMGYVFQIVQSVAVLIKENVIDNVLQNELYVLIDHLHHVTGLILQLSIRENGYLYFGVLMKPIQINL
jgi:hypothetical protein